MLDPQDEFFDRRLATHLVSLYHQTQEQEEEEYLVWREFYTYLVLTEHSSLDLVIRLCIFHTRTQLDMLLCVL